MWDFFQATILGRGPWESIPCHGNPNIMAIQIPRSGLMSIRPYCYVFISIYNPLLTMKHIIILLLIYSIHDYLGRRFTMLLFQSDN